MIITLKHATHTYILSCFSLVNQNFIKNKHGNNAAMQDPKTHPIVMA